MKKLFVLVLICSVLGMAYAAGTSAKKANTAPATKSPVEMIVVESEDYAAGKQDVQLTEGLANFLGGEAVVTALTVEQAKQNPALANLNYSFLPLYLIKKTPEWDAKFDQALKGGYLQQNNEYYILEHQTRSGVYQDKEAKPGVLEIFVMSQCPYGVMAENLVIQAKNEGKIPSDVTIRLRYIVSYDKANNEFRSLHGSAEWEEDVRQLLIAKYYPEKLWKYLEIRNKDYRSSRWDKAMQDAGINVNKIMKKFDTEGMELLKAEAAYGQEYNINASPSFLWEGKEALDFGSVSKKEGLGFLNPSQGKAGAAAPTGSC